MDNAAWIAALPKLDLHCHLDGSIRPQRIRDYLTALGEPVPEDFDRRIAVAEDCPSLTDYLRCFDLPLRWLQTREGLEQAVVDLLWDVKVEHTRYLEVRFAPTLHLEGGLTYTQVFQALADGVERGQRETGVCCRLIVCAMRHHTEEQNLAMLEAAKEFYPHLVCAADLAGNENAFPTNCHRAFFQRARELGIPFTIHSGETGNCDNIRTALELGACRLGHGIAMGTDVTLQEACRKAGVGLELCPTSNFQTKAARDWSTYPLKTYLHRGLTVCLNTDNRTVSRTDLNREYLRAMEEGGCTREEVLTLLDNACAMSFAPEAVKSQIRQELTRYAGMPSARAMGTDESPSMI